MRSTYYPGVCTKPGTSIRVGLCTRGIHKDRMRSTYYPGVCTKPGTVYCTNSQLSHTVQTHS